MNLIIKGLFKKLGETKELNNGKTIQKFYLDLDTETEYPTVLEFQNYGDKVDLSKLIPGDEVTVHSNFSGREWTNPEGKEFFFQSLTAWKIEIEQKLKTEPEPEEKKPNDLPW